MAKGYTSGAFCAMTGISRETLRHYRDKGMLKPTSVGENGYALYSDLEVLRAIMIRYYRGYDVSVESVKSLLFNEEIAAQLEKLNMKLAGIDKEIERLQFIRARLARRMHMLELSSRALNTAHFSETGIGMRTLLITEAVRLFPDEAARSIEACMAALPNGYIGLVGDFGAFIRKEPIPVSVGFCYTDRESLPDNADPKMFAEQKKHSCIVTRVCVSNPLLITPSDLQPIYDELERLGLVAIDGVFGHVMSMERFEDSYRYYITMRVHVRLPQ